MRKYWIKRIICFFLCICLFTGSFAIVPTQKVHSAEYVAGIIGAVGGAPVVTALLVGGIVVAGGISLYELSQTSVEDHRNFVSGLKESFNEFVVEQETIIAKENNQSLTDQEASDIGVAVAREKVNDFFSNTIETSKTKAENIKLDTIKYWNLYSSLLGDNIDNGFSNVNQSVIPSESNPVQVPIYNNTLGVSMGMTNSQNKFNVFQDRYYITKGYYR